LSYKIPKIKFQIPKGALLEFGILKFGASTLNLLIL